MKARDRFIAAAHGEHIDRPSVIYWPGPPDGRSDVVVIPPDPEYVRRHDRADNRALLVEVPNPFGRAWVRNIDLNGLLKTDPQEGVRLLVQFVEAAKTAMAKSLEAGADGVLYRLHGATSAHCTPMEYSGHYLAHDRELLEGVKSAAANMIFVVGDHGLYIDMVADLPAQILGWDDRTTGISHAQGHGLRRGPVACFDENCDIQIHVNSPSVAHMLEKPHL